MEQCYIIAGLGNPGAQYARTRHNIRFMAVEKLAEDWRARWATESKFAVRLARVDQDERRILLCEPRTYLNASGGGVRALVSLYRVELQNLLVLLRVADRPLGPIR